MPMHLPTAIPREAIKVSLSSQKFTANDEELKQQPNDVHTK